VRKICRRIILNLDRDSPWKNCSRGHGKSWDFIFKTEWKPCRPDAGSNHMWDMKWVPLLNKGRMIKAGCLIPYVDKLAVSR